MSRRGSSRSSQHSGNTQSIPPAPIPNPQAMSSAVSLTGAATPEEGSVRLSQSSRVTTKTHDDVLNRDGACIICGRDDALQVCHIIGRTPERHYQIDWLWKTSIDTTIEKNRPQNLITLCMGHHPRYDHFRVALVPSQKSLEQLKAHEKEDYTKREHEVAAGRQDPGRTVPERSKLDNYCEFLVLLAGPSYMDNAGNTVVLSDTPGDLYYFTRAPRDVDFRNGRPILDKSNASLRLAIPHDLSIMALIAHALQALNSPYRPMGARVGETGTLHHRVAYFEEELLELRRLYNRRTYQE